MTSVRKLALAALLALPVLTAGGCATDDANRGPAYVVVEENVGVLDRRLINRMSILDNDTVLIDEGAGRYYQAKTVPACLDFGDIMASVQLEETGMGIDRGSAFIVNGRRCTILRIDRVERAPRPGQEAPAAEG